jgi:hypothetical protein
MKMIWHRGKKHIDQEKEKAREQAKRDLRALILCGDEDGYVKMIKALKPGLTREELASLVLQFREERRRLTLPK